jgi:hypothetical protein
MDPATDQQQRQKRVRLSTGSDTDTAVEKPFKGTSPLTKAKFTANIAIASLPPAIQPLAKHFSAEFLKLRTELGRLLSNKKRLAIEEYIPISARVQFTIGVSDRVKENAAAEFDSMMKRQKLTLEIFQMDLKEYISESVDLEIKVLRSEIGKLFARAVGALSAGTLMGVLNNDTQARTLVLYTIESHHETLFRWTETSMETFFETLKTATTDANPVHVPGTLNLEDVAVVQPHYQPFHAALEGIFGMPWDDYEKALLENKRHAMVTEFVGLHLKEAATLDAAMDLENEQLTQAVVEDIINARVAKETRELKGDLNRLTQQVKRSGKTQSQKTAKQFDSSKNKSRGGDRASAPSTNKKGQKQSVNNAQKADAADNASTDGRRTKKNKPFNKNKNNSNGNSRRKKQD